MKDFLESCKYKPEIKEAIAYEQELAYFIQTHLSSEQYVNTSDSIDRVWNGSNPFLNWMKGWMRKDNFNSFMKFLRHPLPTASLVQDDIVPELKKVFDATNAYYNYRFTSKGSEMSAAPLIDEYSSYCKDVIFNELIYNHNSIAITDFIDKRKPYRYLIKINSVVAIEPTLKGKIKRIIFKGVNSDGEERYFYYTDEFYSVYIEDGDKFTEESNNPHEIGECPADFISVDPLNVDRFVVRKSKFSNSKERFENYVNYYTLQKLCLPNGAIPITTHYKSNNKKKDGGCGTKYENGTKCVNGYISGTNGVLGNKDSLQACSICNPKTIIQAGAVFGLPVPKFGENGERPFDLNANFVKFHYIPTDILKWWDEFVDKKYSEIKYQLVGKGVEDSNGQAKNKDQIARGNQTLENTLIEFSRSLSLLQKSLDSKMLKISHGKSFVDCFIDKGSDFYLETEFELRDSLAKAIDPIDKSNIMSRINYSIHKNNPQQLERNSLLYNLLPYSALTDSEFIGMQTVDPKLRELRLNFKYYVDAFEAEFGELGQFFNEYFGENVSIIKKLEMTRNLLLNKVAIQTEIQT